MWSSMARYLTFCKVNWSNFAVNRISSIHEQAHLWLSQLSALQFNKHHLLTPGVPSHGGWGSHHNSKFKERHSAFVGGENLEGSDGSWIKLFVSMPVISPVSRDISVLLMTSWEWEWEPSIGAIAFSLSATDRLFALGPLRDKFTKRTSAKQ